MATVVGLCLGKLESATNLSGEPYLDERARSVGAHGVIEIMESENVAPGLKFLVFYPQNSPKGYLKTTVGELVEGDRTLEITTEHSVYRFVECDAPKFEEMSNYRVEKFGDSIQIFVPIPNDEIALQISSGNVELLAKIVELALKDVPVEMYDKEVNYEVTMRTTVTGVMIGLRSIGSEQEALVFESYKELAQFARAVSESLPSKVYTDGSNYFLLLEEGCEKIEHLIVEFGCERFSKPLLESFCDEHYECCIDENAIEKLMEI